MIVRVSVTETAIVCVVKVAGRLYKVESSSPIGSRVHRLGWGQEDDAIRKAMDLARHEFTHERYAELERRRKRCA